MDRIDKPDFSQVAPHRRAEVARRIGILESFIAGDVTRREAVTRLGMTEMSFYNLLRAWRGTRQPGALIGSGRPQNRIFATDPQRQLILDAEASLPTGTMAQVMARAEGLAELRGIDLPGVRTMKVLIGEIRRGRGLRPEGVVDILVTHCAVDLPVRGEEIGIVAPVVSLVLSVGRRPVVLGLSLSLLPPGASSSARALLDALSGADRPRVAAPSEFRVMVGSGDRWYGLREAFEGIDLPLIFTPARPRSWREVIRILGDRPGGLKLKPDVTDRPPDGRITRIPQGGSSLSLEDAEMAVKEKLGSAFGSSREAILADEQSRRLTARLQRLIGDTARSPDLLISPTGQARDASDQPRTPTLHKRTKHEHR